MSQQLLEKSLLSRVQFGADPLAGCDHFVADNGFDALILLGAEVQFAFKAVEKLFACGGRHSVVAGVRGPPLLERGDALTMAWREAGGTI